MLILIYTNIVIKLTIVLSIILIPVAMNLRPIVFVIYCRVTSYVKNANSNVVVICGNVHVSALGMLVIYMSAISVNGWAVRCCICCVTRSGSLNQMLFFVWFLLL